MKPVIVLSVMMLLAGAGSVTGGEAGSTVSIAPASAGNEMLLAARPAAKGESPEDAELKKLPPPAKANRPLRSEAAPSFLDTFLSLLNPIGTAQAAGERFSVYHTPNNAYNSAESGGWTSA